MSQSTPHYIGNPLFEASTVASTTTTSTISSASYYNQHDVVSRRQAFVYGSASGSEAFYGSEQPGIRLRPRSHDMFNTPYGYENGAQAGSSSRYLDVPSTSYRYSVDGNLRTTPLTASSLRHHSIDSPEHARRSRYQ